MAMIIVPNQFFGLGDIIFCQTAIREYADGRQILWPVEPQFVEGLNRAYPDIAFIDRNTLKLDYERRDAYEIDGMYVIPLRFADTICNVPYSDCMKSKYLYFGMDWKRWKERRFWKADIEKEQELKQRLSLPEKYNLINRTFGSNSQLKAAIHVDNGLPNIDIRTIEGFSLFDWAGVIENATEIHTVSTSIIYMLEMMDIKAECVHLYPRKPIEHDFKNVEYILERHRYKLHS